MFNAQLTKRLGAKSFDPPLVKKTNFRRFSWKRVNLNCMCLIVCYLFFLKIISRYISIYLIRETAKNSKIQPLARNGHSRRFDRILKQAYKIQKKQKIGKPSHCLIICDQVARKDNKLVIR